MEVENGDANRRISADASEQFSMDKMRIFVGGLGEGVTDDDLRRMFVALGSVDEIEIIRSKGRSMAYLNFIPSSAKSLAKLFSSFNGCVWKGGKLRIEKAKEHYLSKMERERVKEREEEIVRNDAAMKRNAEVVTLKKPTKGPGAEKEQIRLFFPKLRKVKPLPFSGCGKHKYSFRNIPVPSLPTHFCDCELHYVPYDAPIQNGGVDEKEFDLMHSVLNKLISKDEVAGPNGNGGTSELNYVASDENAPDSESDEDGIIINISGAMKKPDFSWKSGDKKISEQGSNDNLPKISKLDDKKLSISNKKRKLGEGSNESVNHCLKKKKDDLNAASTLPPGSNSLQAKNSKWKELLGIGTDSSFKLSNVLPQGCVQESVQHEDTDDETEASADESTHITEEESSNAEETDDEADELGKLDSEEESSKSEESSDELEKQEGTEEESSKSAESDNEVEEESSDELAKDEDTKDESNKLEESEDEVEQKSIDDLSKQEDTKDESNELVESDDEFEQESSHDLANQEDTEDESDDEVEQEDTKGELDQLDESGNVAQASSSEIAEQDDPEKASTKLEQPGENKQLEGVKLTDAEDGSVKKGATWSQVMPWTQLVSDLDNSSFSISQILPSSSDKVPPKPSLEVEDGGIHHSSKAMKVEITSTSDVHLKNTTTDLHEQKNLSEAAPHLGENSPEAIKGEDEKPRSRTESAPKRVARADTYISRPFVRSSSSLKEWTKLKETLRKSGTKKRKTPEE